MNYNKEINMRNNIYIKKRKLLKPKGKCLGCGKRTNALANFDGKNIVLSKDGGSFCQECIQEQVQSVNDYYNSIRAWEEQYDRII
jgi:hypothetical protein